MSGPTTASGENLCVPTSEEVVALEKDVSCEETDTPVEDEEESEVEKSMRWVCGEGVGGEEVESWEGEENTVNCRGTLSDLLLLFGYLDLDLLLNMENLNGLRGERMGNAVGGCATNVGRISRLEERDSRLLVSLSFPTIEES